MITASISGKMAFNPRVIQTKSGKPMTTGRLAVDDGEGHTIWIDLLSFNNNAEWLARAIKGDRIAAMGTLKLNTWQDKQSGENKEVLQLVADNVIVPTPKPKKAKTPATKQPPPPPKQPADPFKADSELPF